MPMAPQDADGRALRLLPSVDGRPLDPEARGPLTAPRRPGERREAVTFTAGPGLRALAGNAVAEGVDIDLAVSVTVERSLAEARLSGTLGEAARPVLHELDVMAASTRAETAAGDPTAAYVRGLLARRRRPRIVVADELLVSLPMRLVDLVDSDGAERAALHVDLAAALRWELAAAVRGQSILEWAGWEALRSASGRG